MARSEMAPSGMQRWISSFLDAAAAERGAARNTALAYGRDLLDAADWLAARQQSFETMDRAGVEAYLVFCEAQGLSKATRARRLSSLRQLFRFAHEEGWRADNPALRIAGPGASRHLPKTLSLAEVERLLDAARTKGHSALVRLRNTALFELLYATGMRVSELVELPLAAVKGDPKMILVRGKGDKERMVPLSAPARAAVAEWLAEREVEEDLARKAGKPAARPTFVGSEAGFQFHAMPSNVTRAQVQKELADWRKNPATADGYRDVGGEAGWASIGHRYDLRDGKFVHADSIPHNTPKPSLAMTPEERAAWEATNRAGG